MTEGRDLRSTRKTVTETGGEEDCNRGAPLSLGMFTTALEGLKQDIYDKLDSKIDSFSKSLRSEMTLIKDELKSSVATLQITVDTHGSTIKDLERSATSCSDDLDTLNRTVNTLQDELKVVKDQLKGVQAKCDDLEGRSLCEKPKDGGPPPPFIVRVHYFHMREEILRRAREAAPLLHQGKRLSIFADFAPAVAKMRAEFGNAKRLLRTCPGVKFGLFYPAELRITLPGGALRKFTDPAAAVNFINRDLGRAAPPNPE
ncbi:hypothetical protein SKAU_G00019340 [Synaphobranchus kaupii]|uniref:Transposase element L1Md-A101/L1Md-A102/L1Md-A2 n=1 Tax=Synaphobranchus kaupii TaxID=118154 RepID=A0A9Q1GCT3_SYNKA|nr:hypothetical protein SKAU_G00019340 [Synaphobranchus kaupii]